MFRGFTKLLACEFKLFFREPLAAFFTFVFPVFFLFLTMEVFVPEPIIQVPAGGRVVEIRVVNHVLPNLMVMIIATTSLMSLPLTALNYREIRFLKRLKANPVTSACVIAALGSAYFAINSTGVGILTVASVAAYGAENQGSMAAFLFSYTLSFLAIAAMGFGFIGSLVKTSRTGLAIGQILYFPAMFFSGVFVPLDQLPGWVRPISEVIPFTHAARFMQGIWRGLPLGDFTSEIIVLLGLLAAGAVVSARNFRWE